jgi:hypothetical protein
LPAATQLPRRPRLTTSNHAANQGRFAAPEPRFDPGIGQSPTHSQRASAICVGGRLGGCYRRAGGWQTFAPSGASRKEGRCDRRDQQNTSRGANGGSDPADDHQANDPDHCATKSGDKEVVDPPACVFRPWPDPCATLALRPTKTPATIPRTGVNPILVKTNAASPIKIVFRFRIAQR